MATPASISKNSFDTKFWIGYPVTTPTSYPYEFQQMLVEEYNSFGTEIMMASSQPIDDTRSERSGQISFKKSSMEIKTEFRHYNLQREIACVLYANLNLNASTYPLDKSYNPRPITSMVTSGGNSTFGASGGNLTTGQSVLSRRFRTRDFVIVSGLPTATNNKMIYLSSASDTALVTSSGLIDDDLTNQKIVMEVVGHRFEVDALNLAYSGGILTITNVDSTPSDPLFTEMGLERGQWLFIGGDAESERFAPASSNYGYARIKAITDTVLTFDLTTWTPETSVGSGKNISIFYGTFIKNRSGYSAIVKTYKAGVLQLGHDADGIMSKGLLGVVSDEMKFTFPTPGDNTKVTVDTKMVAISSDDRTGVQGLPVLPSVAARGEISFAANPSATNNLGLNGTTWTFVASGASGTQTNIGANLAATLTQLVSDLNASANANITPATYSTDGTKLIIVYDTNGESGNYYTMSSNAANATPNGSTLSGGNVSTRYVNAVDDLMYTTSGGDNRKFVVYKRGTGTSNPVASFAYVIEGDLTIANSADVLPAIGYTEGYDVKYSILKVSGSLTCAFLDNNQVKDINNNEKYGIYSRWNRAYNRYNQGVIMDMPKVDVKTEGTTPKLEDEMMLSLDISAKRDDDLNAVISFSFFNGLPAIALT